MKKKSLLPLFVFLIVILIACRKQEAFAVKTDLAKISNEKIEYISDKKILFMHMSVGDNILDGIRKIQEMDARFMRIQIQQYELGSEVEKAAIYHNYLGNNTSPEKKMKAFEDTLLDNEAGQKFDAVVFKYCYVDFNLDTDVDGVFTNYNKMILRIKTQHPDLAIVHLTVPLTVRYSGFKGWVKSFLDKEHPNGKRSYFNEKLVQEYESIDKIFDLAKMESTDKSGKRLSYNSNGRKVFYMANEHTNDGGHLNEEGQILAAIEFINILSDLD